MTMTDANRKPRQTAANNKTLAATKRLFNVPIFREASAILNSKGEAAALAYLQQYVVAPIEDVLARYGR